MSRLYNIETWYQRLAQQCFINSFTNKGWEKLA